MVVFAFLQENPCNDKDMKSFILKNNCLYIMLKSSFFFMPGVDPKRTRLCRSPEKKLSGQNFHQKPDHRTWKGRWLRMMKDILYDSSRIQIKAYVGFSEDSLQFTIRHG